METNPRQLQNLSVYPADALVCAYGANEGDAMGFGAELVLDDIYVLRPGARQDRLSVLLQGNLQITVARDSPLGKSGNRLILDCLICLMSARGGVHEGLLLVEVDATGDVAGTYLLPFAELQPRLEYTLMRLDRQAAPARFAQLACVSFARGTRVTLGGGKQRRVEDLTPGDGVLTRDDGVQPLRWIGCRAQRAVGRFAPIRIASGALNNAEPLIVSPNHRLFVYQRKDVVGAGGHEVLVRAADLVDGHRIQQVSGGFVDYFQLLFDRHQIIFAEGIAAETLLLDNQTRSILPTEMPVLAGHLPASGREIDLSGKIGAAEVLRRASRN